jgi:predicted RNase H-like HicB family nuclease
VQGTEVEFVFEPDPDGGYHAYAPELPGLHAEGGTLKEAVSNAEEALAAARAHLLPLRRAVARRRPRDNRTYLS